MKPRFTSLKLFSLLSIGLLASQCSHSIHLVHVSDFEPKTSARSGRIIQATSEQLSILGFKSDTNYVEEARQKLMRQCPRHDIEGITTQFSTSHGFFSWTNKILMKGVCLG